jgi:glyoxylase-like metal-dependent hydrolase (beta-lactamase superfamily II)
MMSGLPPTFRRIVAGDTIRIGGRAFEVSCGGGHSPEQVMLLCRSDGIFLAADQVLAKISPNVSVWAVDPEGDPLGRYLRSLETLAETVAGDVLVLPGHNIPFFGLHQRIAELAGHHEARCRDIAAACSGRPRSAAEIVPVVFKRPLDPHQMGFAFSEILAHVNYMLRREELLPVDDGSGVRKVVASPGRGA